MAKFKIVLDREEYISCQSCVEVCTDSFELADDEQIAKGVTG